MLKTMISIFKKNFILKTIVLVLSDIVLIFIQIGLKINFKNIIPLGFFLIVPIVVIHDIYLQYEKRDFFIKIMKMSDKNSEVYINKNKIDNPKEVIAFLKEIKVILMFDCFSSKACVDIKIKNKNSEIDMCLSERLRGKQNSIVKINSFYSKETGKIELNEISGYVRTNYFDQYINLEVSSTKKNNHKNGRN